MNNKNTTHVNGNLYSALKPYQQEFVRTLANWWDSTRIDHDADAFAIHHAFDRATLRRIAIENGLKCAPAWIVKDKNRKTKNRGEYLVPEVADYIIYVMPTRV